MSDDRLKDAKELLEIQGRDGNWNHDDYMLGMYNGMECIIATLEKREPLFRSGPIKEPNILPVSCCEGVPATGSMEGIKP